MIVDNQPSLRRLLSSILDLQPNITVVGEAPPGKEAVHFVRQYKPDIVFIVIRIPVAEGLETSRAIRGRYKNVQVIFLIAFDEEEFFPEGMRFGAIGFLLKDISTAQIIQTIRTAARHEPFPQLSGASEANSDVDSVSSAEARRAAANAQLGEPLSEHEFEILEQVCEGKSNREIALALGLALGTVKNRVTNIFMKMLVRNRFEAMVKAREVGLL
jgi:DNA-binding NarL/FixJ family response regulator